VALLTAVMVLGWLWGPAGLLLATPLTVCLVVLGRHLPELELMSLILGATPALAPHLAYYQRLIAGDRDEATGVVESFLAAHPPEHVFDQLLLPTLSVLKTDRLRNAITDADRDRILHATRQIVDDTVLAPVALSNGHVEAATRSSETGKREVTIVGVPANDVIDELAVAFFGRVCGNDALRLIAVSPGLLSSEVVEAVERRRPHAVCIGAVPPGGVAATRHLVKRLRARMPGLVILVGRWSGDVHVEDDRAAIEAAGASHVATTLAETRRQLGPFLKGGERSFEN
jgi:hypothetical protein